MYSGPSEVMQKTADVTGYPEWTVRCIVGEKASLCGAAFTSPTKWYKVDRRNVCLDDFDVEDMQNLVHDFLLRRRDYLVDSVPPCGEFCVRWALSTRKLTIRSTFMSNPASSTRGTHTCNVCE